LALKTEEGIYDLPAVEEVGQRLTISHWKRGPTAGPKPFYIPAKEKKKTT
jgi:hypothetical protein